MNITHVDMDDWQGTYFDDDLVEQGHSYPIQWVLERLQGKRIGTFTYIGDERADKVAEYYGGCPATLTELMRVIEA